MIRRLLLFCLVLLISYSADAQRRNRYKWEANLMMGATNFLGDLGGANQIGTNGFRDLEFVETRQCGGIGLRYKNSRYLGYQVAFNYGQVRGDDKLTTEEFRHNRNINFKSNIFEFGGRAEFYVTKERAGHMYNIRNVRGWRHVDIQVYGFLGVAGFYFNPKSQYNGGAWYALQPLHTGGQGLPNGPKQYKRINVAVPIGIGFKYAFNRQWSIGIEYGMRKTFTDYIDDVSGVYYDKNEILSHYGPTAAYFADPSLNSIPPVDGIYVTGAGQIRGDATDNDAYMFAVLTVNYKFSILRRTKPKF